MEPPEPDHTLLDITAHLKRRKALACTHEECEVAADEASLTCATCGADLDPWWFLRRQVERSEQLATAHAADVAAFRKWQDQVAAFSVHMKEKIERLSDEVNALIETKNRLWNEQIAGRPLGTYVRRRRRRA